MKDQNRFYLYLPWPKYLAQWYAHEMYRLQHFEDDVLPPYMYDCDVEVRDLEPVRTQRGSAERNIIEVFLTKQPSSAPAKPSQDTSICLEIPNFVGKPACTYNYLTPYAQALLERTVRNRLRVELTKYLNKVLFTYQIIRKGAGGSITQIIEPFMEQNGIENTESNYESLRQLMYRMWNAERMAQQRKKKKEHENTGN